MKIGKIHNHREKTLCHCSFVIRLFGQDCSFVIRLFGQDCSFVIRLFGQDCSFVIRLFGQDCSFVIRLFGQGSALDEFMLPGSACQLYKISIIISPREISDYTFMMIGLNAFENTMI